jgi:superfamily II DNA or RNA helicase
MKIIIKNELLLSDIPDSLAKILCKNLTIPNPQYTENKKYGRWNGKTCKFLRFYKEITNGLILPRGYINQLCNICNSYNIPIVIEDKTRILPEVDFAFNGELKPLQNIAATNMLNSDFGTLSAPTGSGKTVIGLYLIAKTKQPALIIVHTTDLLNQWVQRIKTFLGIPEKNIGIIGTGQSKIGKKITVALVQSLYSRAKKVFPYIGYLIVDECHRVPSRTFSQATTVFDCRYMLGLSATTYRRDNLSQLIFLYLGDIEHEINKNDLIKSGDILYPKIIIRRTNFRSICNPVHEYSKMISELIQNKERNFLICADIAKEISNNNICLVLSDRKAHCNIIQEILNNDFQISSELLTGDIPNEERQIITNNLNKGQIKVLVATGQLIGEGFDCKALSVLFLATPIKFAGRVVQYTGRILRPAKEKKKAILYDYVDIEIGILRISARERKKALTM